MNRQKGEKEIVMNSIKKIPVFLPGWGQDKESMRGFQKYFFNQEILLLDLPGFGKEEITKKMTVDDYVDFLIGKLKEKNVEPSILIGHSFGGKIAIHYASRNPIPLLLIAPSIVPPKKSFSLYMKKIFYPIFKKWKQYGYVDDLPFFLKGSLDYQNSQGYLRETFLSVVHDYPYLSLKDYPKSVVVIGFNDDKAVPYKRLSFIKKVLPNVEIKIYPGDHFGYFNYLGEISHIIRLHEEK